jgi:bacillithiol synthase
MRIESKHIENQNKLIRDYRDNSELIMEHFDYGYSDPADYEIRLKELNKRTYKRQQLTDVLSLLNQKWDAPKTTFNNIERLKEKESVVVVGGQQAGVLTGPLYSVNKVISIIQMARKQEERLGVPVIPVFWIAGEDHDFDEINHIFLDKQSTMKKYKVSQRVIDKRSISDVELEQSEVAQLVDLVVEQLPETKHTRELRETILHCLQKSTSYVDFFARLTFRLFPDDGLVLIDSGSKHVRKLESDFFVDIIKNQSEINNGVYHTLEKLRAKGYSISLDVSLENGNLFYHKEHERVLLNRNQEGNWVGKQREVVLTNEELLTIAKKNPEKLSNNVVTRPLMQELLLPTLAFIGGPGEISYWSVLKPAFHALNIKMPPVVPRLSFTYVDRKVAKIMEKYQITSDSAINGKVSSIRNSWFRDKMNPPIEETVTEVKENITRVHEPLRNIAAQIRSDISDLAGKNLRNLIREIEFLEKKIIRSLEEQYQKELDEFSLLENVLYPGGLQERIWNPIPYVNRYGVNFFQEISNQDYSFDAEHYIVYI